jgi:hypothetical protein
MKMFVVPAARLPDLAPHVPDHVLVEVPDESADAFAAAFPDASTRDSYATLKASRAAYAGQATRLRAALAELQGFHDVMSVEFDAAVTAVATLSSERVAISKLLPDDDGESPLPERVARAIQASDTTATLERVREKLTRAAATWANANTRAGRAASGALLAARDSLSTDA